MPTIYQLPMQVPGMVGVFPNQKFAVFGDNLATITTAGYLNQVNLESNPIAPSDILQVLYSFNQQTQSGTYATFTVSISNSGVITLAEWSTPGAIVLPTIANHIATFTNTTGTISEDPATAISGGNIQAGLSGTAGFLASFPTTAATGSLRLVAASNAGNTVTQITNASFAQASVLTIPDPAGATANFIMSPAALVNGNLVQASGTAGLVADSGVATTALMKNNAVNTMTGAGQIILAKANGTEAANAVTASGNAGVITTSSLTTAGGANYSITWTNTLITSTSVGTFTIQGGTNNATRNITFTFAPGSGTATLVIYNNTAATSLNGTILIGYTIL